MVPEAARHAATARLDRLDLKVPRPSRSAPSTAPIAAKRFLVTMTVQQSAAAHRCQRQGQPSGAGLADQEFLEQHGVIGNPRGAAVRHHGGDFVAEREQATRLETHDGYAACRRSGASAAMVRSAFSRRVLVDEADLRRRRAAAT